MSALFLLLACTLQEPSPFPFLDKDPWEGFKKDSRVVRSVVENGAVRLEEIIVINDSKEGRRLRMFLEDGTKKEGNPPFTSLTEKLQGGDSPYKVSGKGTKVVKAGRQTIKGQIREFTRGGLSLDIWRVTTAKAMPGGVIEVKGQADIIKSGTDVKYSYVRIEPVRVANQKIICARFDLKGKMNKKKVSGTWWLSTQVPGLIVRSIYKETEGKKTTEKRIMVTEFESVK